MIRHRQRIARRDDDEDRRNERLRREMEKHARGAGHVLDAVMYEPAKGGGWAVLFDTEYAALKVHYKYLGNPTLRLGKTPRGWVVSTRERKIPGGHVHGCPECYEKVPCVEACSIELDLFEEDETPCGAYVTCESCRREAAP